MWSGKPRNFLKEIRLIHFSQIQNQGLLHHFKTRILNIRIMSASDLPQKIVLLNLWTQKGSVAKNLAFLQNKKKPSQLGKLIIFIRKKMAQKGENYSVKMQKYYFCTTTDSHAYFEIFATKSRKVINMISTIKRGIQLLCCEVRWFRSRAG